MTVVNNFGFGTHKYLSNLYDPSFLIINKIQLKEGLTI